MHRRPFEGRQLAIVCNFFNKRPFIYACCLCRSIGRLSKIGLWTCLGSGKWRTTAPLWPKMARSLAMSTAMLSFSSPQCCPLAAFTSHQNVSYELLPFLIYFPLFYTWTLVIITDFFSLLFWVSSNS